MTDPLEDLLVRDLARVADAHPPARVDLPGVRRVARAERRRRGALVAGAVAASVALVAVASTLLPQGRAEVAPAGSAETVESVTDLPVGAPMDLAWSERDGTVHLPGGRTVAVERLRDLIAVGGTTLIASGEKDDPTWTVDLEVPRQPLSDVEPVLRDVVGTPVPSLRGEQVAWVQRTGGSRLEVHVLDVATMTTSTAPVPAGGAEVLGASSVDDAGRVVVETRDGQVLWDPAAGSDLRPVAVGGDFGSLRLLDDGRATITDEGSDLVRTASDGTSEVLGRLTPGTAGSVGPDARTYLATYQDLVTAVGFTETGETTVRGRFPIPSGDGAYWTPLGWESDEDVVLVDYNAPQDPPVRCSVRTLACEQAPVDGTIIRVGAGFDFTRR